MEVYSYTANKGRLIKETDSISPWMNRRPVVIAWYIGYLNDQVGFVDSHYGVMRGKQDFDIEYW
jgi:hypothetical protein